MPDATPADLIALLQARVDEALGTLVTDVEPAELYEPVRYVLDSQGKRFRPLLVLLTARALGTSADDALPAALSVEVFHNFTLVHDDIMDHSDERRGRPTLHVRWNDSTAILGGDYLYLVAYEQLALLPPLMLPDALSTFNHMVKRLCEGQMLDMAFETRPSVSVAEYLKMIDGKTGALLVASLELGGIVGGASEAQRAALRTAGAALGRAFQIQDDLLDLMTTSAKWGKRVGGDLIEGKKAYLLLQALERTESDDHAWFQRIVDDKGLPADQVDEARERMLQMGIIDEARHTADAYYAEALQALDMLPQSEASNQLCDLIAKMRARLY
ncbi:MAG: polyprenyl synthetase family protein [Rhodothermales bacterium]